MCAVEWKCLDEIAIVSIGEFVHKDKQNPNAEYPVYNGGISNTGYYEDFNNTGNKIIISARGANAGYINRVFVNYWAGNSCYSISVTSNDVDWNFLFYYLKTNQQKLIGEQQKGGIPAISKKQICTFKIPIPSLAKQQEIVSHLDTFTTLISNLESELDMRRKQYEHYRNQLLDFEGVEGVEWKSISDVATNYTGLTYKPANVSEYGTLVLRSSNINEDTLSFLDNVFVQMDIPSRATVKENDILICVRNGSKKLVGKAAMITKEAEGMAFGAFMTILRATSIDTKFLFHLWHSYNVKKQYKGDDAMPIAQITSKDFKRIIIPVPPLAIQQEIVEKLDAFENLIQSLEQEIKLRKGQYEYYREKLLTFE